MRLGIRESLESMFSIFVPFSTRTSNCFYDWTSPGKTLIDNVFAAAAYINLCSNLPEAVVCVPILYSASLFGNTARDLLSETGMVFFIYRERTACSHATSKDVRNHTSQYRLRFPAVSESAANFGLYIRGDRITKYEDLFPSSLCVCTFLLFCRGALPVTLPPSAQTLF
ncbi:hypothetical protein BJV77DRAFT_963391 [Russula vinacea]|nr:hypothetical protein BJV77DRAFT_963391 [Russula vinacea]